MQEGSLILKLLLPDLADPILAYSAGAEINQLQWSTTQPDWVAINFGARLSLSPDVQALQNVGLRAGYACTAGRSAGL